MAVNLDIKMFLYRKVFVMNLALKETIMVNIMEVQSCILLMMPTKYVSKVTDSMTTTWGFAPNERDIKTTCILREKQIHGLTIVMMSMKNHRTNPFKVITMKVLKKMSHFLP